MIVTLTPLQVFSELDRPGGSVRRCYQHPEQVAAGWAAVGW